MKKLLFSLLLPLFAIWVSAQVPAGQDEAALPQPGAGANAQEDSFVGSLFSDPSEIENIEGLDEPLERVRLRDQDTNLILDMIQTITERYILRPQNLPQVKISFDSMSVLTRRETLLALESLLAMNGIGITKIDSQFFKAVPASGMNVHVPIWLDVPAVSLPPSQRIYVKFFKLDYMPVDKMREILNPFATPNVSSLLIFPSANSIMITDCLVNLQRMEKIIGRIDVTKSDSPIVVVEYNPRHTIARDLSEIMSSKIKEVFQNEFLVVPTFSYKTLGETLSFTCHKFDRTRLLQLIEKFDLPSGIKFKSKLVPLYHADATEVSKMLDGFTKAQVIENSVPSKKIKSTPPTVPSTSSPTPTLSRGKDIDSLFSKFASTSPDARSNGIFLTGTEEDVRKLEEMIRVLDTPLPMAKIDTIFVMVDLSQANQRGIDALFQDLEWKNDAETRTETITAVDSNGAPLAGSDQTVTYETGAKTLKGGLKVPLLNSSLEFDLENWKIKNIKWNQIFSLASQRDDVRIFSTPSLTVSHGGKGAGEDGGSSDSKIVITDTRTIGLPSVNYGDNQRSDSGLKDRTARTELHIANPRIRKTVRDNRGNIIERGTVFVSVTVTAEKFDTTNVNTYEGQSLPSIRGRTAQTDLAIRDGQIMVLGGFREIQMDSTSSKYNLLSDIPYFGEKLFSPSQTKSTPSELMIFIRPSIIDPENPSDDRTSQNTSTIDDLMNPKYTPMFVAPSGKILGVPDQENMISPQDKPSVKPSL